MDRKNAFLVYLAILVLLTGLVGNNPALELGLVSAQPDDGINGYQELHEDWIVTGYEGYTDEEVALFGDLIIKNGGHLVLNNCILLMMSQYLLPYEIIVENGGVLEIYDSYVTDIPDDDDTQLLSAYYYFIARAGSTLIIENSTIRQAGFIDLNNPEHLGLSILTNSGHIRNSRINTTIIGLAFFGDNTGFLVENTNISQIAMTSIMLNNAEGVRLNNISFSETGESTVVDAQMSGNFTVENIYLEGEQFIRADYSYGFEVKNIVSYNPERVLEIRDSQDFKINGIDIQNPLLWNRRIEIERSSNFTLDDINDQNDSNVIFIGESSFGSISNLTGSNITWMIDSEKSDNITVKDANVMGNGDVFRFSDSTYISLDRINITGGTFPIYFDTVNYSSISNLTVWDFSDSAITVRDYSHNISISNVYIKTNSQGFTKGIEIDFGFDIHVRNLETYNLNISVSCRDGGFWGENIDINGTLIQNYGIKLVRGTNVHLSNISILTSVDYGIHLISCDDGSVKALNTYIKDAQTGIYALTSNITLDGITIDIAPEDVWAQGQSFVTIMNSTVDHLTLWDATIICINTTNTTAASFSGISQLIKKWWVDVFVNDKAGPVVGALAYLLDGSFTEDVRGYTGSEGFARNLAATEVIWTFGPTSDYKNPHKTEASGPGWFADNLTFYNVNQNMWVNVTYMGDAPPLEPIDLVVRSDELSNTILNWNASPSLDIKGYSVYIGRTLVDVSNYVSLKTPNATVTGTTYTHLGGSSDWDVFYYGVTSYDNENESVLWPWDELGDWVVNKTSPQNVENKEIEIKGSLMVFGYLQLSNITLKINSFMEDVYGIFINQSGSLQAENITVKSSFGYPYRFIIQPDAQVYINGSDIKQPGGWTFTGNWTRLGIFSQTRNLTLTNSKIDVQFGGLGIYNVEDFQGLISNVSFTTDFAFGQVEFLLRIINSKNVSISNCSQDAVALFGIYAESSSNLNIFNNQIHTRSNSEGPARGIYLEDCSNSSIYDNPLLIGRPSIHVNSSINITVKSTTISGHSLYGIHVQSSLYTTITGCNYDISNDRPDTGIYMSWCRESIIRDMNSSQVDYFIVMENESKSTISNLSVTSGNMGISIKNSDNVLLKDIDIHFISSGMLIEGGGEITLDNLTINLTLFGLQVKSGGPVYLLNSTLKNCISGELLAQGYKGDLGNVFVVNSTIASIGEKSFILNNSAVVYLVNTSFNLTKLKIEDSASRLEVYHFLSVQIYDIDNNVPPGGRITILNSKEDIVYDKNVLFGFADLILIHDKTVFQEKTYLDNPHTIFVFDGSHLGDKKLAINYSQHIDVKVSNQFPIVTLMAIYGFFDNPDPVPDDYTVLPTTKYDIILNYTYEDPENDPESQTIIHWYVNGVHDSTFDNITHILPQYTQKGELWQAYVYPSDGYNSTYPILSFKSNVIPIVNTPPSVFNVNITPTSPTGEDSLFVSYEVFDLDNDGLDSSKTTTKWYRYNPSSGLWDYSTIDNFYLPSQYTLKGEKWKCIVTPHDGDNQGMPVDSQEVVIGNTPPSIQNVRITSLLGSAIIYGAENLRLQYMFLDADSDSESGSVYQWEYQRAGGMWTMVPVNSSILPYSYTQRGDLWRCRITPKDGEDFGSTVQTEVVEIYNTPPLVTNVSITPSYATSSDSLKVTYNYYDYDGDMENGTSYRWVFEDALGSKDSGIHGNVTPSGVLVRDHIWYCFVIPSDGINVGPERGSNSLLIHNSPAAISSANIQVITTETERHLWLSFAASDIDLDFIEISEIRWYKNNASQPLFDDNQTVVENYLVKSDLWHAQIRVNDGLNWSNWFTTDQIEIPNAAPSLSAIPALSPSWAKSDKDLVPDFESLFEDGDGDSFGGYEIWWYRDNGHMEDYDDLPIISRDLTTKGQIWFYKVRVSDGEDFSEWYSSKTSVIENSAPSNITSSNPDPQVSLIETETMEFQVWAQDSDGDPLSFRWTLDGRIVLFEEGVSNSIYLLKTDYDSEGEYILRLVISDGEGTNETTWDLTVTKKNRLPEIKVVEPEGKTASIREKETLDFAITKSDADSDNLQVEWFVDGVSVFEGSDKYSFTPDYSSSRNRVVQVMVSETVSGANSTFSWDVSVADMVEGKEELLGMSYDAWGLILAVISGLAAILLFLFGFVRVRKKKGRLKEHMVEMDRILSEDEDPDVIEGKLMDFEANIRQEFSEGKLEDLHFLMLNEIIASRKGEVRKAEVTQKFGRLPKSVVKDLDKMLEDGNISKQEYEDFVATLSKSESLSPAQKKELSLMIGEWEAKDIDEEEEERPKKKEKLKKEDEENEPPPPPPPEEPKNEDDEKIKELISSLNGEEK